MKTIFTFAIVSLIAATTFGGEIAVDGTQSVLAQPVVAAVVPAPAAAVVVVAAPAAPCANGRCHSHRHTCANGTCSTKLYSVDAHSAAHTRNRLFGGTVTRQNSRTVVRPVR
jgi:hypothetical protein